MGHKSIRNLRELIGNLRSAKKRTGRGYSELIEEVLRLRYGETGLGFGEYFGYDLYDPQQVSRQNLESFVSIAVAEQIWRGCNPPHLWGLANDKLAFQLMMERMGYSQPKVLALYDISGRQIPGVKALGSLAAMKKFLQKTNSYPIFAKPTNSMRSLGAIGIKGYDKKSDSVALMNGEKRSFHALAAELNNWDSYLFQESLSVHPELAETCGSALSTLRVVILVYKAGPRLFRVAWKIPNKKNMADNFWRPGNLLAHIKPETGEVYALVQSTISGHINVGLRDTLGELFYSRVPPLYDDATKLALEVSRAFGMFRYQAWDIALTDKGPVALELNHNGALRLVQLGAGVGLLDDDFRELLAERALVLRNPKRKWLQQGLLKSWKSQDSERWH